MVDFINEVEEELRKDKYNQLLRKFGPYIVGLIIVVVATTGYYEYNKYTTSQTAKAASAAYESAGDIEKSGDIQTAIAKFTDLAELAPDGYAGLSLVRAAGLKVQLGDMNAAVALFDEAAAKFEKPLHKDLAGLKAAYILLDLGRYGDVQARLGVLAVDGSPYQNLAKELLAQAAYRSGDIEAARTGFTYLSNAPGVASGIQSRAAQGLALINAQRALSPPPMPEQEVTPIPESEPESIQKSGPEPMRKSGPKPKPEAPQDTQE